MSDVKNIETARAFMHFMIEYNSLIRRHLIERNQFRIHSHSFSMLYALRGYKGHPITMTKFAAEMGITKQQLTKLVNDLEDMEFVVRSHSNENRRQVYIEITDKGLAQLEKMIGEVIHEVICSVCDFEDSDKDKIISAAEDLIAYFKRDAENCAVRNAEISQRDE